MEHGNYKMKIQRKLLLKHLLRLMMKVLKNLKIELDKFLWQVDQLLSQKLPINGTQL